MNIHEWLKERGYRGPVTDRFKEHAVYFHRSTPGAHHQWVVCEHYFDMPNGPRYHGFEVQMTYETKDKTWVKSSFYALSEQELKERLDSLEQRLMAAVAPMGGNPLDYQGGEDTTAQQTSESKE